MLVSCCRLRPRSESSTSGGTSRPVPTGIWRPARGGPSYGSGPSSPSSFLPGSHSHSDKCHHCVMTSSKAVLRRLKWSYRCGMMLQKMMYNDGNKPDLDRSPVCAQFQHVLPRSLAHARLGGWSS